MKIPVKYNNSYYFWVDTVITCDDCNYAILVSNEGVAFPIRLEKIEVVDESYHFDKHMQREIFRLKCESSLLKAEMEVNAKLRELQNER